MGQFGAVSGGTGLIEIYAHFTKLYFYPYRFQFYTGYFYHEISQYIMMYHSNPCQTMMASIFYYFPSISSKVLKSPYKFIEKILQKKL